MKKRTSLFLALLLVLVMAALSVSPAFAISTADAKAQVRAYHRHSLGLTSVKNARDLGGYKTKDGRTVKFGKLLRTGELVNVSSADKKKLVNKYRVKKDIDLRSADDIERNGADVKLPGATYYHFPYSFDLLDSYLRSPAGLELTVYQIMDLVRLDFKGDAISNYFEAGYMSMYVTEKGLSLFRNFFDQLLAANGDTVLFHCVSGKDRTGNAAMLLLSALGVDKETIVEDFMLSNYYFTEDRAALYDRVYSTIPSEQFAKDISSFAGVTRNWIRRSYDIIETHYGSVDGFLKKGLGLTNKDLKKLQKAYLQ